MFWTGRIKSRKQDGGIQSQGGKEIFREIPPAKRARPRITKGMVVFIAKAIGK
jgi:hypothetical protein